MPDDTFDVNSATAFDNQLGLALAKMSALSAGANGFASAMTRAFNQSVTGGKQFDDVLKSLGLRLSGMAVASAFKSATGSVMSALGAGLTQLSGAGGGMGARMASGGIKPFAAGGVIGTPTYFPLMSGGVGLAGEAGPEAILPLQRGSDGRLGVAAGGRGGGMNVTINIATRDAESFRRSETYIAGQIARAVARGQRSL